MDPARRKLIHEAIVRLSDGDPVLGFRGTCLCAAAGAVAGVWIAVQETHRRAGIARWAVATSIALLGASLACLDSVLPG